MAPPYKHCEKTYYLEEVVVVGSGDLTTVAANIVMVLVPMILSLTVHEFAHAWSAMRLGDNTAEAMGRLTLNPVPHVDPIGTLLLPIILSVTGAPVFFGWAKPVPVNPIRFTRKLSMRTGMLLVSAAGPISNIIMAVLCTALLAVGLHTGLFQLGSITQTLLGQMVLINVVLALFNLIPVGPLDGQKVLSGLLSGDTAARFERFNYQYGMWLMVAVIAFGGRLIGIPFVYVVGALLHTFGLPWQAVFS